MRTLLLLLVVACRLPVPATPPDTGDPTGAADTDVPAPVDTDPVPPDTDPAPVDADGDGHAPPPAGDDCDDALAAVHPGAVELCDDGVDQDCDPGPARCGWWGEVPVDRAEVQVGRYDTDEAWLGAALAGGEDLTGDGVPDLAIGAPLRDLDGDGLLDGLVHVLSGAEARRGHLDADRLHARLDQHADALLGLTVAIGHDDEGRATLLAGAPWTAMAGGLTGTVVRSWPGTLPAGPAPAYAALFPPDDATRVGETLAVVDLDGVPGDEVVSAAHVGGSSALVWARLGDDVGGTLDVPGRELDALAAGPGPALAWAWHDADALGVSVLGPGLLPEHGDVDDLHPSTLTRRLGALGVSERTIAVAVLPDVTGDGAPDLAVGLPCRASTCASGGDVVVVPGGVPGSADLGDVGWASPGLRLVGGPGPTALGRSVAYAGDVDGNGVGDLLVGEPGHDGGRGAAWLLYGPLPDGTFTAADVGAALSGARFVGTGTADALGTAGARVGDLEADGRDEVAIAAPLASSFPGKGDPGRVYVLRGRGD